MDTGGKEREGDRGGLEEREATVNLQHRATVGPPSTDSHLDPYWEPCQDLA